MMRLAVLALFAVSVLSFGCSSDKCKAEAPSVQIDVTTAALVAASTRSLRVELVVGSSGWRKSFDVGESFLDGQTSIAVVIEPAPAGSFTLEVAVSAIDGAGAMIGSGAANLSATPDGCNRLGVALGAIGPGPDGGPRPDAGDAGVAPDGDLLDAVPTDGGDSGLHPDALPNDGDTPDAGPEDTGVHPDAEPIDLGLPDAQGAPFNYTPTNFTPSELYPLNPMVIDCGAVVFDSTTLQFDRTCGGPLPTAVALPQVAGPNVAVIATPSLVIADGSTLRIVGQQPVIIAVFGPAAISGLIDATAATDVAGPGGSNAAVCAGSAGQAPPFGRGGGGGGSFSSVGGTGGSGGSAGGNAGVIATDLDLAPLRGGCGGGDGASGGANGGGGGGAVQISSSGVLTLSATAQILAGGGGGIGGGRRGGGGGGGSGGAIFLEGDLVVTAARLLAHGGGGGGGGPASNVAGGGPGENGDRDDAQGGPGSNGEGGDGGDGAGLSRATGATGSAGTNAGGGAGGGGGGGGMGLIRVHAQQPCTVTGTISPTAITACP